MSISIAFHKSLSEFYLALLFNHLSLYLLGPTLVININPTTLTVLDVSTYNLISINCNVTQPPVVTIPKTIAWRQTSPSEVVQPLSHDGTNINITSSGLENSASTSQLSVYATAAGRWRYTCSASLHVPGDPVISYSQTAEVIVKGMCPQYVNIVLSIISSVTELLVGDPH